jgi:hypothetical protein
VAARKRPRKRGKGVTILILLVTSAIIGVALWAIRQVTLQGSPTAADAPKSTAAPPPREVIQPSERERLEALLRETENRDKGAAPAN